MGWVGRTKPGRRRIGVRIVAIGALLAGSGACDSGASTPTTPAETQVVSSHPTTTATPTFSAAGCVVGISWNNYTEERLSKWDELGLKWMLRDAGATFIVKDARSSPEWEADNIDALLSAGARVLIVRPQDAGASLPAVRRAIAAGVPVIAYEYYLDEPRALRLAYDPIEAGRQLARSVVSAKPSGTYAIVEGEAGDPRFEPMRSGVKQLLQPIVDSGAITIAAEVNIPYWDPVKTQLEMKAILAAHHNRIDAVIVENDGMAGGVIAALKDAGLEGKVAVSGWEGDWRGLNRVALGKQVVDVWQDPFALGLAAGNAAAALCANPDILAVPGVEPFVFAGHPDQPSILLAPQAITKDTLDVVLDRGWIKRDVLCADVNTATGPAVCK